MRIEIISSLTFLAITACPSPPLSANESEANHAHIAYKTQANGDSNQDVVTDAIYPRPDKQPNYGPAYGSIEFVDTDPSPAIGGLLRMGRAVDGDGNRIDEGQEGITTYMIHWGLEVGAPGPDDDKGAGDHGGDCRGFRDTTYIVMKESADLDEADTITWTLPEGTIVPQDAVYFVGHTLYGPIHNLGKCTQIPIHNLIE